MSGSPDVILLRSADAEAPDRYCSALGAAGWSAVCEPVLTFRFPRQAQLRDRLDPPDRYTALLVTSPRAATAIAQAFADDDSLAQGWADRTAYAVGPKTAGRLRSAGLRPQVADTGTAEALAARIVDDAPDAPLLFLSGNRRREALPEALTAASVPFDELVVYETHARPDLTVPVSEGTSWLVFFSPSGLEAVTQADGAAVHGHRIAAIGPTTAQALEAEGHSVEAVAEEPSPEGLVTALRRAERASP